MNTVTGASLEHQIGSDGLLALRLRDGEVRLRGVDGETVRVRDIKGRALIDMFEIESAPGSLSLKVGRGLEIVIGPRSMRRGHGRHTPELEIELPRRATLVIEASSGDVGADGLIGDQRYRTASGDIVLRAVSGRISLDVVSGDIDLTATGDAEVTARSVSGDIGLRAARLSTLQLASTSGDLKVAGQLVGPGPFSIETVSGDGLLAPATDVRIEMASVTGELTTDLDGRHQTERGRRILEIGARGPLVTFRSMSGDLHVARPSLIGHAAPTAAPTRDPVVPPPPVDRVPANGAIAAAYDHARLRILQSLERGEIAVDEAAHRLETLDAGDVTMAATDRRTEESVVDEQPRANG